MINVAIFPCGSEAGLEIHNALRHEKNITLFGASSVSCHGEVLFNNYDNSLPFITADNFESELNAYLVRNKINFIFPAYDEVIVKLAEIGDRLAARAVIPSAEVCNISRQKSATYTRLAGLDFVPGFTLDPKSITDFPVFAKPDKGQGSQGIKKIESKIVLDDFVAHNSGMIYCELLTGTEYTIDCFTDRHGQLKFFGQRTRERVKSGISVRTTTSLPTDEIRQIATDILERIPFCGAWFFQLKRDAQGKLKLLEVAARVGGSMAASRVCGGNLALMSLYDLQGIDVNTVTTSDEVTLERYLGNRFKRHLNYDHVYLDFDDTVTHKGKVNLQVLQYLYYCHNLGKGVTLITRHQFDLDKTLSDLRLSRQMFSDVIHILDGSAKSQHIRPENAIFIDDSFVERLDVHTQCSIPVFSVDAVESLIDWRTIP
mgnify:FL=1